MLVDLIASYSMKIGMIGTIALLFFVILAVIFEQGRIRYSKTILFLCIVLSVILPTFYFIGSTVYINSVSSSRGPVHWHADIEVFACGEELDFLDPKGLSNKVGAAALHEHNDKKIHLEGVVVAPQDASLGKFFSVIGGALNNRLLAVPTERSVQTFINGAACPDGTPGFVQVFVYSTKDGSYTQEKISNPESYIIAPHSQVPPGDCIIIEYGVQKTSTGYLCHSYKVAEQTGKVDPAPNFGDGVKRGDVHGD